MPFLNSLIVRWLASLRACVDASRGRSGSGSRIVKTISVIKNPLPNYLTTQLPPSKGWSASGGNWRQRRQGFSLVELLIGILIIGLISTFIASIYLSHFKLFTGQSLAISVADQNKIAMDEIVNNIRQATQVYGNGTGTLPCNKNNCDISITAACGGTCLNPYTRNNGVQLVLQLWPLDSNGNPFDPATIAGCYPDHISYYLGDDPTQTNQQPPSGSPTLDTDGYYHLTRETKRNLSNCSTRQSSKDIIATKILSINFTYTPSTPNTTEVKITLTNEGKALWKAFNPYTYSRTSLARLKNRPSSKFGPIPISFPYTLHGGTEGIRIKRGTGTLVTINNGNVHSNASISGADCTPPNPPLLTNCRINGNASAVQSPVTTSIPSYISVSGSRSVVSLVPFPTFIESDWQEAAANGGTESTNCTISTTVLIGPKKYDCSLLITSSGILKVTGPIWVTGTLTAETGSKIEADATSLGSKGTVVMVSGRIDLLGARWVKKTAGGGYLLFYTTSNLLPLDPVVNGSPAIDVPEQPYYYNQAIYYAPNGTVNLSQENHGLEGAAIGKRVTIDEQSDDYTVEGNPNLTNAIFSTGNDSPPN